MINPAARRLSLAGPTLVILALLAAAAALADPPPANPVSADTVPVPTQRIIQAHFAPGLVLPALALWRFENMRPYEGGGNLICGHVNFQKSTRQYIGYLGFYAVVQGARVTSGGIEADSDIQDPTGAFKFAYHSLCEKK